MMKKILYTLMLTSLVMVGCQESKTDKQEKDPNGTPIVLNVGSMGVGVEQETTDFAATRAVPGEAGQIMVNVADFGTSKMALYAPHEISGVQNWEDAHRLIDTLGAVVLADGSIKFMPGVEKAYFPESGNLSVYSLYPSPLVVGSPLTIADDKLVAPTATIKLETTFAKQFDILHAKAENVTAIHAQNIKIAYQHVLAQLRFKIYREAGVTGTLTKIVVKGVNKATMSVKDILLTTSTDVADSSDFIAFDGTMVIDETTTSVGVDPILLIPGKKSISTITITVDGQDYTSFIPANWNLAQGKINTLTLKLRKFGVRFENEWTVSPWAKGTGYEGDLENNGKVISVSSRMVDANKNTYSGITPTFADIEIDGGYTHKGIPVTVTNGVFQSEKFNTGIIHDEPLSLTALTLYSGANYESASVLFDGRLTNGLTADNRKIIIDTIANGQLTINNGAVVNNLDINLDFGGFGEGTNAFPYEVANATTLINVAKFQGRITSSNLDGTTTYGASFVQVADVDLKNQLFIPLSINSGAYNGNGYVIKNLLVSYGGASGLFGVVNSPSNPRTVLKSIVIESGSITFNGGTNSDGVGGVVGKMDKGQIIDCVNKATVNGKSGANVGGIVGRVAAIGVQISGCVNYGAVNGRMSVGGIVGEAGAGSQIFDCYNVGNIDQVAGTTQNFGGIAGKISVAAARANIFKNCYSTGIVNAPINSAYTGSVVGLQVGAFVAPDEYKNIYCLAGGSLPVIGNDMSKDQSASAAITAKTDVELKEAAMVDLLNAGRVGADAAWKMDLAVPINGGYPILVWQK